MVSVIGVCRDTWALSNSHSRQDRLEPFCCFLDSVTAEKAEQFVSHYNHWATEDDWPIIAIPVRSGS